MKQFNLTLFSIGFALAGAFAHADSPTADQVSAKQDEIEAYARIATDYLEESRRLHDLGNNTTMRCNAMPQGTATKCYENANSFYGQSDLKMQRVRTHVPGLQSDSQPEKSPMDQMTYDQLLARDVWVRAEWRKYNAQVTYASKNLSPAAYQAVWRSDYQPHLQALFDESHALEKQAAIVKLRGDQPASATPAVTAATAKPMRKARDLSEILGQELTLDGTYLLNLSGQNTTDQTAFTTGKRDDCTLVMDGVADFPAFRKLNEGEDSKKITKWKVDSVIIGERITAPLYQQTNGSSVTNFDAHNIEPEALKAQCSQVVARFRAECIKTIGDLGTFSEPNTLTLISTEGKKLTLYARRDLTLGLFSCLEQSAFNMPQVDDTSGTAVQTARDAGIAH